MIFTPVQFEVDGVTYTTCYVGEYLGQPGNWWHCHALDVYVGLPIGAPQSEAIAAFTSMIASQETE